MTEDAFLQAIAAEPHDDTHRLVYADWLDEHGGPAGAARAEFIRTQVELERLPIGDPRGDLLRRRAKELLAAHSEAWLAPLPRLIGVKWHRFWRGFVGGADVQACKFYRQADALFAAAPVQFLRVVKPSPTSCRELAASPYLARLLGLELIEGSVGDEGAAMLASSPHLSGLRSLAIVAVPDGPFTHPTLRGVRDAGALALAGSPHLGRLELLELRHNHTLGAEAVAGLRRRFGAALVL
jgi:uncharacterized protein (TIGR02996 family)